MSLWQNDERVDLDLGEIRGLARDVRIGERAFSDVHRVADVRERCDSGLGILGVLRKWTSLRIRVRRVSAYLTSTLNDT